MGKLKTTKKTSTKSSIKSKVGAVASAAVSMVTGRKSGGGARRHRLTPQKLAKQIMMLKLKKKLAKLRGY